MAFSIPNVTLPVYTTTALGPYRNPTAIVGYVGILATASGSGSTINTTPTDRLGFFIDNSQATGGTLTVAATSTSTQNGTNNTNTSYRGGIFSVDFTSVVATCTVRINIQQADPSGYFFTIASLSIDNVSTGQGSVGAPHASNSILVVYPGATSANPAGTVSQPLPGTFRTQASITVVNTTATSAVAFNVNFALQL